MAKYIIVAGGCYSGTGKGVAAASLAMLMKLRGNKVNMIKFDPYLNINAGILAPREHGECFLCDDGMEADLDLGHYYRLAGIETSYKNIYTSGTMYKEVITEQENGKFLGSTIQIIPHITDKIQNKLEDLGKDNDIIVAEIGGTVGDLESSHFYEAIRQFKQKYRDDVLMVLVSPILYVNTVKEHKTKPLQNSVKELQRHGLQPDILLCRTSTKVNDKLLEKISNLTNVSRDCVFDAPDVDSIYEVPIEFYNRQIDDLINDKFRLKRTHCRITKYRELVDKYKDKNLTTVTIGIICKYDNADEAYISLKEALIHAGMNSNVKIQIEWINAEECDKNENYIKSYNLDGVIVPGGFDSRGVEGKIKVIKYVRENKIPFLGICLGLQCAVIEFARNVLDLKYANSTEFDKSTPDPVVHFIKGQENIEKKVGTMRLGAFDCELKENTIAYESYNKKNVSERHRHRYEINSKYKDLLEKNKFIISGINPSSNLIEIVELDRELHPFFVGIQAHPEFKSKIMEPSPLFKKFIEICKDIKENDIRAVK
jgi:CTP synthase